jgi:hypothetical protein
MNGRYFSRDSNPELHEYEVYLAYRRENNYDSCNGYIPVLIHSLYSLPCNRSIASSKAGFLESAI